MACDNCGYAKTVMTLEREIDGKEVHLSLCEKCMSDGSPRNISWIKGILARKERGEFKKRSDVCPQCGMTEEDLRSEKHPGCSNCYQFFESAIKRLVNEAQMGAGEYVGRRPKKER